VKNIFSDFQKRRADLNQRLYDSQQTHHPDLRAISFFLQYLWMVRLTLSITRLKIVINFGMYGHVSFSWKKKTAHFSFKPKRNTYGNKPMVNIWQPRLLFTAIISNLKGKKKLKIFFPSK
jgi:hypothetical protein